MFSHTFKAITKNCIRFLRYEQQRNRKGLIVRHRIHDLRTHRFMINVQSGTERMLQNFKWKLFGYFYGKSFWKFACKYLWPLYLYIKSKKKIAAKQPSLWQHWIINGKYCFWKSKKSRMPSPNIWFRNVPKTQNNHRMTLWTSVNRFNFNSA